MALIETTQKIEFAFHPRLKFLIVTHAAHVLHDGQWFAYGPYVREMSLWLNYVEAVHVVAPVVKSCTPSEIDLPYRHARLTITPIPSFSLTDWKNRLNALRVFPLVLFTIFRAMRGADHIHLRCPGNVGLIGCLAQMFFPRKTKTAKYAGNWDWNSSQPWSYRLQQSILRSTFLSRNMTTLIYGDWPDRTKNTLPFFTASYSETDKEPVDKQSFKESVKLACVGGLTANKNPMIALEVLRRLIDENVHAELRYCGDGPERARLSERAQELGVQQRVRFLGNVNAQKVKQVLKESHFLVFVSRSEGWPKAVAEAMWWGCVPITSNVSCVSQMVGEQEERGYLTEADPEKISQIVRQAIGDETRCLRQSQAAQEWARQYTLERFESEIAKLLGKSA